MAMSGKGGPLDNVTFAKSNKSNKSRFKAGQNKPNLSKGGGFLNNQVRLTF